jgi:HPt (histidine-containing phosphotransfer) domain-containing protein
MAPKTRLEGTAVKIGTTVGKADRTAHKIAKAARIAKEELLQLAKQMEALRQQFKKSSERLKRALK